MAVQPANATILLVQGSFQAPEIYGKLTSALEARGYAVVHPSLPSLTGQDDADFASTSLVDDAQVVQRELERLVEHEGRAVVVAMHSYGGLVGGEAVPEGLGRPWRRQRGLQGGVVHLVFFAAFVLPEGQSVLGTFGESPNNDIRPGGRYRIKGAAETLYNDLPPDEADLWTSRIIDQAYNVQTTVLTRAAWRYIPSTYVVCEKDQAAPPQFQEMFAQTAGAEVKRLDSGHSPMLSRPEELAELITAVADGAVAHDTAGISSSC